MARWRELTFGGTTRSIASKSEHFEINQLVDGRDCPMTMAYDVSKSTSRRKRVKEPQAIPYAIRIGVRARSAQDLIRKMETGFSYKAFVRLQGLLESSIKELGDLLQIPRRTLTRRKQEGRFAPDESERLLRLSRVLDSSIDLFEGDRETAVRWLRSPSRALSGETPLEMSKTEVGAREVETLIGRLERGVFS